MDSNILRQPEDKSDHDTARILMLQSQFKEICRITDGLCNIVPLKGISLLQTIYNKNFDRAVGDIDILIFPGDKLQELIGRLKDHGYTPQFKYLQSPAAKEVKRKVAMRSPDVRLYSDVDIHTAFISKKFYNRYSGSFNEDALSRCRHTSGNVYFMDDIDQWLYLAQHACFHLFSKEKWIHDLYLLWNRFSGSDKEILKKRINQYNFRRTVIATFHFLHKAYQDFNPKILIEADTDKRFCLFLSNISESARFKRRTTVKYFHEFMFIDNGRDRKKAFMRLIFPPLSLMMTIYRSKNKYLLLPLFPLHSIGVLLLLTNFLYISANSKSTGKL